MADRCKKVVLFPELLSTPRECFDEPQTTSDGGAQLLKAVDQKFGLTRLMARCLAHWAPNPKTGPPSLTF